MSIEDIRAQHKELDEAVNRLQEKKYLSDYEEYQLKELKKLKLLLKDEILLDTYSKRRRV